MKLADVLSIKIITIGIHEHMSPKPHDFKHAVSSCIHVPHDMIIIYDNNKSLD